MSKQLKLEGEKNKNLKLDNTIQIVNILKSSENPAEYIKKYQTYRIDTMYYRY